MAVRSLRVYHGPELGAETTAAGSLENTHTVTTSLRQILPLLTEAVRSERTWLRDFADDDVTISTDLYEVLLAYQHFRRPSA
jgi:hypothetical protein